MCRDGKVRPRWAREGEERRREWREANQKRQDQGLTSGLDEKGTGPLVDI